MKTIFGQQEGEKIYIYVRRHFASFMPFVLINSFFALGSIFLLIYSILFADVSVDLFNILLLASAFGFIASLTIFMVAWIDYYFDIHIVTNHRVIDINQKGLFNRSTSELTLENVEDATNKVTGFLANLFNYGDVEIQTAGTKPNFLFECVAYPREMAEIIIDLAQQYRENPSGKNVPTCKFKRIIDGKLILDENKLEENNEDIVEKKNISKIARPQDQIPKEKISEEKIMERVEKEISGEINKDELNRGGKIEF